MSSILLMRRLDAFLDNNPKFIIMKKIKFEGKLNLNKEVVSRLNDNQMNDMKGGAFV